MSLCLTKLANKLVVAVIYIFGKSFRKRDLLSQCVYSN